MNTMSCSIKALLAPSPNYRWGEHLCLLAPLGTVMAFIIFCLGWWGEPVRQFFSQLAAADISITRFMSVITHIGNPLIYGCYFMLLLVALVKRDKEKKKCSFCVAPCSASFFCALPCSS